MNKDPNINTLVGIGNFRPHDKTPKPAFVAVFNSTELKVVIEGAGYAAGTGERATVTTLHQMTEKQCTALHLGLQIMEFLRTGVFPPIDFGQPQFEPNVLNPNRVASE